MRICKRRKKTNDIDKCNCIPRNEEPNKLIKKLKYPSVAVESTDQTVTLKHHLTIREPAQKFAVVNP